MTLIVTMVLIVGTTALLFILPIEVLIVIISQFYSYPYFSILIGFVMLVAVLLQRLICGKGSVKRSIEITKEYTKGVVKASALSALGVVLCLTVFLFPIGLAFIVLGAILMIRVILQLFKSSLMADIQSASKTVRQVAGSVNKMDRAHTEEFNRVVPKDDIVRKVLMIDAEQREKVKNSISSAVESSKPVIETGKTRLQLMQEELSDIKLK